VPRQVSGEFLSAVVGSLQQGLGGGAGALASNGSTAVYPANATQNEIKIWDNTHKAFSSEEVLRNVHFYQALVCF
jgi:hypothetical protein